MAIYLPALSRLISIKVSVLEFGCHVARDDQCGRSLKPIFCREVSPDEVAVVPRHLLPTISDLDHGVRQPSGGSNWRRAAADLFPGGIITSVAG
jgi:hypothetical protein